MNKEKEKKYKRIIIVLTTVIVLFSIINIFSYVNFLYQKNRADYYQEMTLTNCEISLTLKKSLDIYHESISYYTNSYDSIEFPELEECDYWLLEADK